MILCLVLGRDDLPFQGGELFGGQRAAREELVELLDLHEVRHRRGRRAASGDASGVTAGAPRGAESGLRRASLVGRRAGAGRCGSSSDAVAAVFAFRAAAATASRGAVVVVAPVS